MLSASQRAVAGQIAVYALMALAVCYVALVAGLLVGAGLAVFWPP
jgi:hypothetical protein